MGTVFSHIIQKRFSQVNEDVATDALAYVLESSDAARSGMTKLLRGIIPALPSLRFKTQQSEGSIRPDMWGYADADLRVFIETKFWAGLTDNQPVSYLKQLATYLSCDWHKFQIWYFCRAHRQATAPARHGELPKCHLCHLF